jgi:hypothetical protein
MAQHFLTASDLPLFGTDTDRSDASTARRSSEAIAKLTFARWFTGTFALAMSALTVALIVVNSAS